MRTAAPAGARPPLEVVRRREESGSVHVAVRGEVDAFTSEHLKGELSRAVDDGTLVEIDLSGVDFFDCAGVAAMLAVRDHAIERACEVHVISTSRAVGRVLTLVEMPSTFCDYDPESDSRTPR